MKENNDRTGIEMIVIQKTGSRSSMSNPMLNAIADDASSDGMIRARRDRCYISDLWGWRTDSGRVCLSML